MSHKYQQKWDRLVDECFIKIKNQTSAEYDEMIVHVDRYFRKLERMLDKKKVAAILLPKEKHGHSQ